MDVKLPIFPMIPYDFLAYMDYEELPKTGVRLGVMNEQAPLGRGLVVRGIVSGAIAQRVGLQKDICSLH